MTHTSQRSIRRECHALLVASSCVILLFYVIPLIQLVAGSLLANDGLGEPARFCGARNFQQVAGDPHLFRALLATAVFTGASVFLQMLLALLAALVTRGDFTLAPFLRLLIVAPYFLPTVVVVLAWRFFSDPFVGPLTLALRALGGEAPDLRGPGAALPVMILVATYEAVPFSYAVLVARLRQIPPALYEVAALDGAGPLRSFLAVTWPRVRGVLGVLVLLRLLLTVFKFEVPWLVYARDARSLWADTLPVAIYRTAFEDLQWGKACAVTVSLLGACFLGYALWTAASRSVMERAG